MEKQFWCRSEPRHPGASTPYRTNLRRTATGPRFWFTTLPAPGRLPGKVSFLNRGGRS
jgi:hypothetical protein